MKLFLSSLAVGPHNVKAFCDLVGKPAPQIKLALIENAADPYPDYPSPWLLASRESMFSHDFQIEHVDLRDFRDPRVLESKLSGFDVIFVSGGNTYYLRWLLKDTGADEVISRLVKAGAIYGGASAGAIMAGPTLKFFDGADDPAMAPEVFLDGLHFTDKVVVPHADLQKYSGIMDSITSNLRHAGYTPVPLTNAQAMVISGSQETVI